jgi:hypothetical protein
MRDITKAIHADTVSSRELVQILANHFGSARYTAINQVDMPDSDVPSITIYYTKKGAVAKIVGTLTASEVEELAQEVEAKLLAPATDRVSRKIMFAQVPTTGWWACSAFRLTSAPVDAPRPPYFWEVEHPLVMEVRFRDIADRSFSIQRAQRLHHEYSLALSLFVPKLKLEPKPTLSGGWGLPIPRATAEDRQPRWFQNYYAVDGFETVTDDFPDVDDEPIALVPIDKYYGPPWIYSTDVLTLPEAITPWMEGYLAAPEDLKRRLLRSAYWINHAAQMAQLSQSSSLVAAVQAIEVLLPRSSRPTCPTCGLMQGPGPTASFKEFLDHHLGPDDGPVRKQLYNRRSQLTHGHSLMSADEEIDFGWFHPHKSFDDTLVTAAVMVARVAAINWFMEQLKKG